MGLEKKESQNCIQMYKAYLNKMFEEGYDYYIAVTRKGYYFSKIQNVKYFKRKVLRDRDILKMYDFKIFEDKKILLFDDTANTGETLKTIKEFLEKKTNNKIIVDVAAFAVNRRVLEQKVQKKLFDRNKLFFKCLMNEDEITRFSLFELHEIHNSMISYVIDLPIFEIVTMSVDQFNRFMSSNKENWNFYDYSFTINNEEYNNGFLQYNNIPMEQIFGDALLINIVKCRYKKINEHGQDKYQIRFTPFSMMKSVLYQDMVECFLKIYQGTSYEEYKKVRNDFKTDDYIAVYRDVVYNLSCFVGYMFRKHMLEEYNIELIWDYNLTQNQKNTEFSQNLALKKSIKEIFNDNFSLEKYLNNLRGCSFSYWKSFEINNSYYTTDFDKINGYILGYLSMQKLENINSNMKEKRTKTEYILFEEIEQMMAQKFCFKSKKEFDISFAKIILLALDCSFMSNDLVYKNGEIKRAFRFGEGSELYFGYDIRLFYLSIYTYFNCLNASTDKYQKYYNTFIERLYIYLKNNNYFKYDYITEESFRYFSSYFNLDGNLLLREIRNKRFILENQDINSSYRAVVRYVSNMKFD